ncbi:MAG TPA: hypothetical protein VLN45_12620, partial [Ignavibacteriaceae bacterium]|nr:hypothetical protein [Ignavibacteriaceae bacterium]
IIKNGIEENLIFIYCLRINWFLQPEDKLSNYTFSIRYDECLNILMNGFIGNNFSLVIRLIDKSDR